MADSIVVLRQCTCRAEGCGALFFICRSCDRGQVYCSQPCRRLQRRLQCRAANRRHQQSPEGRADHRDRQRAYRQRQQQARVTDQRRQRYRSSFRLWEPLAAYSMPRRSVQRRQENSRADTFCRSRPGFRPACIRCGRAGRYIGALVNRCVKKAQAAFSSGTWLTGTPLTYSAPW